MGKEEDTKFGAIRGGKAPSDAEDMLEGKDRLLGNLWLSYRRRRIPTGDFGQVSIRYLRRSGIKTEVQKIIDGDIKALLYIFEFPDAFIVCRMADVRAALVKGRYQVVDNNDDETSAAYIKIGDLPHLFIGRLH